MRPLEAREPARDAIVVKPSQPLGAALRAALKSKRRASALQQATLHSVREALDADALAVAPLTTAAVRLIQRIRSGTVPDADAFIAAATADFGKPVIDLVAEPDFRTHEQACIDALICIKYGSVSHPAMFILYESVRVFALLRVLAAPSKATVTPVEFVDRVVVIDDVEDATILPSFVPAATNRSPDRVDADLSNALADDSALLVRRLESAIRDLTSLSPDQFYEEKERALDQASAVSGKMDEVQGSAAATAQTTGITSATGPAHTIGPLKLSPGGMSRLNPETRATIKKFTSTLPTSDLSRTLVHLETELATVGSAHAIATAVPIDRIVTIGGALILTAGSWNTVKSMGSVPSTHGSIQAVGVGDLLVVKQALKGYQAQELSHVENVLQGEHKSSQVTRKQTTEEIQVYEIERSSVEERDQQTTDRFELQHESSRVQKSDESLKLGASLSASYGPMIEFKATSELGLNSSKEESIKSSTTYGKDITTRASSKITERVLQSTTMRTVKSLEQDEVHEWKNTSSDHIIGQYQWLEKLYEAQIFNYGTRTLFDLMVPEPAAFFSYALSENPKPGIEIVKPPPFTLSSDNINIGNYAIYAARYNAVGVEAPPEPTCTVGKVLEGTDDRDTRGAITKTAEIPITDGYAASRARVTVSSTFWSGDWRIVVSLGGRQEVILGGGSARTMSTVLDSQQKTLTCSFLTFKIATCVVTVEVDCVRTPRALEQWKIKTHAAIRDGYLKQLRDYEDKLATAVAMAQAQVHSRNPATNEQLQRDEIKKACISIITDQHFDDFDGVEFDSYGYPQADLAAATPQGAYIRFFEQAFEWEQMMYLYYPYYWGQKPGWVRAVLYEDPDPQFTAFIKAGAARAVVPVRPGFEAAVDHFLQTGLIWQGSGPPLLNTPNYLNIADEIRSLQGATKGEVPVGTPWEVRVPTTLIKLRTQSTLPSWVKDASGHWIEAP